MKIRPEDALEYHSSAPAGKVSVVPTKPCRTQRDLSLACTPGVAVPCLEIERDPSLAYKYTAKANLVAVISNGTAVLGLGDIGALAGKKIGKIKIVFNGAGAAAISCAEHYVRLGAKRENINNVTAANSGNYTV